MKAPRHLIASIVLLAGLAYASTAMGQFIVRGFTPRPVPEQNAPAQNNEVAPEPPAEDECDVEQLKAKLKAMLKQRRDLKRDLQEARKEYRKARAQDAQGKAKRAKREMEQLKNRIKRLDRRIERLRAQINRCQTGAVPPLPELNDPELDQDEDDALGGQLNLEGMKISCKVPRGAETTSVLFRNVGQKTIPAGTSVTWSVKAANQSGEFSLPENLPAGAELTAADLLKSGVPGSASCQSRL
jgi:hypothetical protein